MENLVVAVIFLSAGLLLSIVYIGFLFNKNIKLQNIIINMKSSVDEKTSSASFYWRFAFTF